MKKLTLDIDAIQVVSFSAEAAKGPRGTIPGYSLSVALPCGESIAGSCDSCDPLATCLPMLTPPSRQGDC